MASLVLRILPYKRSDPPGGGSQKKHEDQPSSLGAGSLMGVGVQDVTECGIFPGRVPIFLLERLHRLRQPWSRSRRPRIGLPQAVSAARGPRRGRARSGRGGGDSMRRSVPSRSRAAVGRGRARRLASPWRRGQRASPAHAPRLPLSPSGPSEEMTLSPSCVICVIRRAKSTGRSHNPELSSWMPGSPHRVPEAKAEFCSLRHEGSADGRLRSQVSRALT